MFGKESGALYRVEVGLKMEGGLYAGFGQAVGGFRVTSTEYRELQWRCHHTPSGVQVSTPPVNLAIITVVDTNVATRTGRPGKHPEHNAVFFRACRHRHVIQVA